MLFLSMAITSISGLMIKLVAPLHRHASEQWVRDMADSLLLGIGRRWWAKIHLWAGVVLLVLLAIHIAMHWQMIDGYCKKYISNNGLRITIYITLLVLLLIMTIPWLFTI